MLLIAIVKKTEQLATLTSTSNHHPSPSATPATTMMMDRNNTPESLTTKSPLPTAIHTRSASIEIPPLTHPIEDEKATTTKKKPNKGRFFVRVWQMIAAIGAFGFQVGATPVIVVFLFIYLFFSLVGYTTF